MKTLRAAIKEINKLIELKNKATNMQFISSYNKKINKLKTESITPRSKELERQLPIIKEAIKKFSSKGFIYFPYENDIDILEEFFLENKPSEKQIIKHVEINSIDSNWK